MKHQIHAITEFFTLTIILRYIVAKWVANQVVKLFRRILIRTERDLAVFLHYRNKAMNKKHI